MFSPSKWPKYFFLHHDWLKFVKYPCFDRKCGLLWNTGIQLLYASPEGARYRRAVWLHNYKYKDNEGRENWYLWLYAGSPAFRKRFKVIWLISIAVGDEERGITALEIQVAEHFVFHRFTLSPVKQVTSLNYGICPLLRLTECRARAMFPTNVVSSCARKFCWEASVRPILPSSSAWCLHVASHAMFRNSPPQELQSSDPIPNLSPPPTEFRN